MRQTMIAGNWKMNGSSDSVDRLVEEIKAGLDAGLKSEIVVCPPFVYLSRVDAVVRNSPIKLGAQDVSDQDAGAFTGEVSGVMLKDVGCQYVIIGHSERRTLYGESDAETAKKFAAACRHGLKPILCVGETLEEREQGITEQVVARQLDAVIELQGIESLADAVIAYEPVWAIGTGKTATPEQAQVVHRALRQKIASISADVAANIQILYGGSMNAGNAAELLAQEDVDGGLVGGASLIAKDFLAICRAAG